MNQHVQVAELGRVDKRQSAPTSTVMHLLKSIVPGLVCLGLVACGDGSGDHGVTDAKPVPGLSLFAGNAGGQGASDGTGTAASFRNPAGIAIDAAGNLYVADYYNNMIRKVTPAGDVTTVAGSAENWGSADGIGVAARFLGPTGITADTLGTLYVTDSYNNTIRKITPDGTVSTLAGKAGVAGTTDGTGAAARFNAPAGIAVDFAGNLYVIDGGKVIRKITPAGTVTTLVGTASVGGSASIDGTAATARFSYLSGIACDSAGILYVTDKSTIRKVTPDGTVTTLAGTAGIQSSADGPIATASFGFLFGIARDALGNLYVADGQHTIRKITPAGMVSTLAGAAGVSGTDDGIGAAARFLTGPNGIVVDASGNLYVIDSTAIRKVTPAGMVTTLAGTLRFTGTADGSGAAARFIQPAAITADPSGNLFVADRQFIRKITPSGMVSTLAGVQICPLVSDVGDIVASNLAWLTADAAANVYLADPICKTITKIAPTGEVSTLAGPTKILGSIDGTAAATLPITAGPDGNLYVADGNTIRKITPAGVVTTLAGTPGVFGADDGIGAAARFGDPSGIASDQTGNLYVADTYNRTIRKITPAGVVTTLAGTANAIGTADGVGPNATFNFPSAITIDPAGNLYVTERWMSTIRKVSPTGVVTTIAGVPGRSGILLGNLPGELDTPLGVAFIGSNTLAVTTGAGVLKLVLP